MPFGQHEFDVSIRYFEDGNMRRFETTIYANSFVDSTIQSEKLLMMRHPRGVIMSINQVHTERKKHAVPRLIFTNPSDPKEKA